MSILLGALINCRTERELEQLWGFVKETKVTKKDVETSIKEAQKAGFHIGCKVRMHGDDEIGEMIDFNKSSIGLYTGDRFPIIIKFDRGTFEYNHKQFEIV